MGPAVAVVLCLLVFAVLGETKQSGLQDLLAEGNGPDHRRVIDNTGDETDHSRGRKAVRQSNFGDTIRAVQEPITGPGHKEESVPVKDKGGGDDDDRKTLAQQVADGKYGLIQSELFSQQPHRLGIITYEVNPEVPKDNVNNLGGLQPEEIWLAENHLLVLAGGGFSHKDLGQSVWPAIDNYVAPPRQVKIPPNPKVPPPFPVQLKPGGPVEFIRNENGTGGPPPFFPPLDSQFPPSPNASFPYPPAGFNPGNFTVGNGLYLPPPFPFYPPPPPNGSFLPPPGFLPPIPPGAAFLPPPENRTDQFDEDDPSIYYPPPYDFYFPKDNSSLVPPGPLVPGIVLPPPPDFFAPYKNTTASKSRRPISRLPSKSKTPTRKPMKHKNVQILTSTEDAYKGVTLKPYISEVNILTTPAPVVYTTYRTPVTTEIHTRPIFKTTTNSVRNKITPKTIVHTLPANAVVKGWVPIPAPHPYYITGPRKSQNKGTTTTLPPDYNSITPPEDKGYIYNVPDYELSINSWLYPNKTKTYEQEEQFFNVITESPKQNVYYDDFYLNKGQYSFSSESPHYNDQAKLKSIFYPTRSPPTSTVSPTDLYHSQKNRGKSSKTFYFYEEPHITEGKLTDTESLAYHTNPSQLRYQGRDPHTITEEVYSAAKQQPLQGQFKPSPLDYFYSQDAYIDISAPRASTESPLQYYFVPQGPSDAYSSVRQTTPRPHTSTKPPVYEYSFSIPGYGAVDPPKVGDYQTTARPYQQQYYTTPAPSTTPTPQRDHTDNPYHAFFTHHDADLIDDITKKYFTTFGQKLNKDTIRGDGLTTPLPPVENIPAKSFYPQTTPRPEYYQSNRHRTNSALSPPEPIYSQYYDQRQHSTLSATPKPISLGSDILVNYKEPLPPVNPDAEFIDPSTPGLAKPDQSFISYRLPGNGGGHFFFLTPQVVQQSQQYSDYLYRSGSQYKRNARRRHQSHSPTS